MRMRTPVQRCSWLPVRFPVKGPLVSPVAPVQATRHRCAGNRRTFQQKTFAKSASKLSAAGSASSLLGAVAMNALLFVPNVPRRDTSRLAINITKMIRNCTNGSPKRAGSGGGPVPADPPPQNALSQSNQKKLRSSKTSSRRPAWKGSEKD